MSGKNLFESDSDSEDEPTAGTSKSGASGFTINESYASIYDGFRRKEQLQKLKDRYGDNAGNDDDDDETSSSSEDEDAEEITKENEVEFFAAMAALKKKDPKIYDGKVSFFKEAAAGDRAGKASKRDTSKKPLYIGDLERKIMTEKEGEYEEVEDAGLAAEAAKGSYVREMEEIRESFKVGNAEDDDEDGDSGLLKAKVKTKEEKKQEESDYRAWLAGQTSKLGDSETEQKLKGLRDFWSKGDLDEDEAFLKDFILNKRYLGEDCDTEGRIHDSDGGLSEDEATVERQEDFETKYNFRFEEPDQEFIKKYPRTIKDSMRARESTRKKKREEVKERKRREKERRAEDLKQLKALKRREIEDKVKKLRKVGGNKDLAFENVDMDGDFDPEEYDRQMAAVFEKYDKVDVENEGERPEFSDDDSDIELELETENWDEWTGEERDGNGEEDDVNDPNFVMDCDYEESSKEKTQKEILESTRRGSRRRKSRFAQALERKKPSFDPEKEGKTFGQYLEEYYKLDYEDMIGDMPCRFRYRDVESNNFGLSTEEVLSAPDKELNAWCSLRKTCSYRDDAEERRDVAVFRGKANNFELKKKLLPSLFKDGAEEALQEEKEKKASKSKKRKRKAAPEKNGDGEAENNREEEEEAEVSESPDKKKRKQKAKTEVETNSDSGSKRKEKKKNRNKGNKAKTSRGLNAEIKMADSALEAYQIRPNQLKRKAKKKMFKVKAI